MEFCNLDQAYFETLSNLDFFNERLMNNFQYFCVSKDFESFFKLGYFLWMFVQFDILVRTWKPTCIYSRPLKFVSTIVASQQPIGSFLANSDLICHLQNVRKFSVLFSNKMQCKFRTYFRTKCKFRSYFRKKCKFRSYFRKKCKFRTFCQWQMRSL